MAFICILAIYPHNVRSLEAAVSGSATSSGGAISSLNSKINNMQVAVEGMISSILRCQKDKMFYAPEDSEADANGCVSSKPDLEECTGERKKVEWDGDKWSCYEEEIKCSDRPIKYSWWNWCNNPSYKNTDLNPKPDELSVGSELTFSCRVSNHCCGNCGNHSYYTGRFVCNEDGLWEYVDKVNCTVYPDQSHVKY